MHTAHTFEEQLNRMYNPMPKHWTKSDLIPTAELQIAHCEQLPERNNHAITCRCCQDHAKNFTKLSSQQIEQQKKTTHTHKKGLKK